LMSFDGIVNLHQMTAGFLDFGIEALRLLLGRVGNLCCAPGGDS
jgi:hypothetical protein